MYDVDCSLWSSLPSTNKMYDNTGLICSWPSTLLFNSIRSDFFGSRIMPFSWQNGLTTTELILMRLRPLTKDCLLKFQDIYRVHSVWTTAILCNFFPFNQLVCSGAHCHYRAPPALGELVQLLCGLLLWTPHELNLCVPWLSHVSHVRGKYQGSGSVCRAALDSIGNHRIPLILQNATLWHSNRAGDTVPKFPVKVLFPKPDVFHSPPIGVDFQEAATKPSYGANWLCPLGCPLGLFQPPKALTFRNLDSQKLPAVAHVARCGIEPASLTSPWGTKLVGKNLGGSINSRTVDWLELLSSEKQ